MKKIIDRPLGLIFVLVVGVLAGLYTASTLSVSMYPSISKPKIQIWISNRSGMTTEQTYETYIEDIRQALESLEDAEDYEYFIYPGGSNVRIEFDYEKDRIEAKQDVMAAFESFRSKLPEEEQRSLWIGYDGNGSGEFAGMFYSTKGRSVEEVYDLVRPLIHPRLGEVNGVDLLQSGVSRVNKKQITIEFREIDLVKYGLFLPRVLRTIRSQVDNIPSGVIKGDRSNVAIRTVLSQNKVQNFKDIVLKTISLENGPVKGVRLVRLSDVANVFFDKQPASSIWQAEGAPANIFSVSPVPGGNLWEIVKGVRGILADAAEVLPQDIKFKDYLDPSVWVWRAIRNMMISAVVGTLIAIFIILLFLGNLRSTLLIGISIPSSLILSVIAMKTADININMISLGGMALAVGMIVDSSIVVLENIFRIFEERKPASAEERVSAIVAAVKEVRWPIVVSTITSVIVFLPLSYTSAMTNAILGDMSRVVVFALIVSVVAALVYLPIFARYLFQDGSSPAKLSVKWNALFVRACDRIYLRFLSWAMKKRRIAATVCFLSFVLLGGISVLLVGGLQKEIVAESEALIFRANFTAKYVNDSALLLNMVKPYEKLMEEPRYKNKIEGYVTRAQEKNGSLRVLLREGTDREAFEEMMEKDFVSTPDLRIRVSQWNPTSMPLPNVWDALVNFNPFVPDDFEDAVFLCEELSSLADEKDSPYKSGWCQPWSSARNEIQVEPNKFKIQRMASELGLGLSGKDLADYMQTASDKKYLGEVYYKGEQTRVYGRFKEGKIKTAEDIGNLAVVLPKGSEQLSGPNSYSLKTFVDINMASVVPMIRYTKGARNAVFLGQLKLSYRDKKGVGQEWVKEKIKEIRIKYPEHRASILQQNPYVEVDRSISSLTFSLLLSLVLILCVLVLQFQSIKQSLIIMLAIPLGIFGVVISLFVFKSTLSLNSMLGIILLSGVAVNNSILIVDFYNSILATGLSVKDAVLSAVRVRFRPIMMTMLTTIFAMLPIALSLGSGGKTLQPLGVAVSGGLLVSSIFTLIVVPLALFLLSEKRGGA